MRLFLAGAALCCLFASRPAQSQVVIVPETPQIGSANPVTADPPVARPHRKPCVVDLFQNLEFADFSNKIFSFTPPSHCPGPWSKVVFTADFTVTAGRQFDRTAAFYLGHANIYYGTTAEPSALVSPSWHIERDVTDLSAIFKLPQTGEADLGNFVGVSGGVNYTGIIYANAALEFYPASPFERESAVPDVVVPLPDADGGAATLSTTASQLSQSVTLPVNTERVYLDVIAQSQSGDEFWYTCVPNDVTGTLESCGNTAFRETEVSIDNQPAGVAPVYPWIYTGGIDPYLWRPVPGVQTLDFKPYRVDLTPFAGLLADGKPHTVAISVYNANSYFLATANLLVYIDKHAAKVTGAILLNTLTAAPEPVSFEDLTTDSSGNVTGTIGINSDRSYEISGYLNTSHGRIKTTVEAKLGFNNTQAFIINETEYFQGISQATTVDSKTTVSDGWVAQTTKDHFSYPFYLNYKQIENADGSFNVTTEADQNYIFHQTQFRNGFEVYHSKTSNNVKAADTLVFNASGALTSHTDQSASQTYSTQDSTGKSYNRTIFADGGVLTGVTH